MRYKYFLPGAEGKPAAHETEKQVLVIIGANGSGKSHLGAWMEKQAMSDIHRIGAQRNLSFNDDISLKTYSNAEDLVFYGTNNPNQKASKGCRWDWGQRYTTKLIDDYENVLAALLALRNNENDKFVEDCKKAKAQNLPCPEIPITVVDKLKQVWNDVFPQRELLIDDSKFHAKVPTGAEKYNANSMSDGERSVLYFAAQIICVPKNKTLIIDEPEVHLHRSIMMRLWRALEKIRPDCFFVYITHDTQFASLHEDAEKLWVKSYSGGARWEYEFVTDCELPEQLLLDVLGNRKSVLLVEGTCSSYDTRLYELLYPERYVIPCGGCSKVIEYYKAFKGLPQLHHCKVDAIVDRDFRTTSEIEVLRQRGISVLDVAEVENLFVVPEVLEEMASLLGVNQTEVENAKRYVIDTKFGNVLHQQINQRYIREIKFRLETIDVSKIKSDAEVSKTVMKCLNPVIISHLQAEIVSEYQSALTGRKYAEILKLLNMKSIANGVGKFFGLDANQYCEKLLRFLSDTDKNEKLIKAFYRYVPEFEE